MGHIFYVLKVFHCCIFARLDLNPEYWEGKRGTCAGAFQQNVAGEEPRDTPREIILTLVLHTTTNQQMIME
jgi:intraflagellar transport protein 56